MLFKGTRVALPKPRPAATKARKVPAERSGAGRTGATVERYHEPLFEELRALRKRLADARGWAPYMVFPDTTLKQMAAHLPTDRDTLLRLHGVGQQRASAFGDAFLEQIADYRARTLSEPTAHLSELAPPPIARRVAPNLLPTGEATRRLSRCGCFRRDLSWSRSRSLANSPRRL